VQFWLARIEARARFLFWVEMMTQLKSAVMALCVAVIGGK
jgi:hypothetical protein